MMDSSYPMILELSVVFLINFSISVGGIVFPGVLILFDSSNFDIISEMSWLCTYGVKIDSDDPKVILRDEQGREICFMDKERKNFIL